MMDIRNYYEQLVIDRIWIINQNALKPLTRTFIEDIACLTLNQLPPCYVRNTTDKSANITERQYQEMMIAIDAAITQSIELVRRRPHDDRDSW